MKSLVGLILPLLFAVEACHNHSRGGRHRGKRQLEDINDELSNFFTECMKRKSKKSFESWRSVVDVSIRDFIWFKSVDQEECKEWQDNVSCWQGRMDALVDQDSLLLGPARECVLEYGAGKITGGFQEGGLKGRKKRETVKSAIENNELVGDCPGKSFEQYDKCMIDSKEEVTDQPIYFRNLHMPSVDKYVLEDVARCRFVPVKEAWNGGRITYRRICKFHRYQDDLGNNVPEAKWQCLAEKYLEILRADSKLRVVVDICNEELANETFIHYSGSTNVSVGFNPWGGGGNGGGGQHGGGGNQHGGGGHGNSLEGLIGYCPSDSNWTPWFNNNLTSTIDGDEESLTELKKAFPEEFACEKPQGVQMKIAKSSQAFHNAGNSLSEQSPEKGIKCLNAIQQPGRPCEDFKVRFCCAPAQESEVDNSDPMKRKHGDVVGVCGEKDLWTEWMNQDEPYNDGSDYETFDKFRTKYQAKYPNCQSVAVQAQIARTGKAYDEAHNNLEEVHPTRGIVCRKDMQPLKRPCTDFKVRFCCRGMATTKTTTASTTTTTTTQHPNVVIIT